MFWKRAFHTFVSVYMYIFMKRSFPKYDLQIWHLALQTRFFRLALIAFWKRALHILYILSGTRKGSAIEEDILPFVELPSAISVSVAEYIHLTEYIYIYIDIIYMP